MGFATKLLELRRAINLRIAGERTVAGRGRHRRGPVRRISLPPTRFEAKYVWSKSTSGRVAEWLKAPDSKSGVGVTLPEVRILSLPPTSILTNKHRDKTHFLHNG